MARLPALSADQILKKLLKAGYSVTRQKGSHIRLIHQSKRPLTVPDHRLIGRGLLRKIIRDSELSIEEFNQL